MRRLKTHLAIMGQHRRRPAGPQEVPPWYSQEKEKHMNQRKKMSGALPPKACPLGYVRGQNGRCVREPGPRVRRFLQRIFQEAAARAPREHLATPSTRQGRDGRSETCPIQPHHRGRLAVAYVRLATVPDTDYDRARIEHQRAQRQHAYRWGWRPAAVQVIDEDIGRGGGTTENRSGFERLCRMIARGEVGLVLVSDLSRVGRSVRDFYRFLGLCRRGNTLVAVDGKIGEFHPSDSR